MVRLRGMVESFGQVSWLWLLCGCLSLCQAAVAGDTPVQVTVAQQGEAFIIDAAFELDVPVHIAWDVLTDFDHMASIVGNVKFSRVARRDGNLLIVQQEGVGRYGIFSFSFRSEREIRLEPMRRILARNLSGTAKRMESEARIVETGGGSKVAYHAELVPDSGIARMFGAPFIRHEVAEQFTEMPREMLRRARSDGAAKPK